MTGGLPRSPWLNTSGASWLGEMPSGTTRLIWYRPVNPGVSPAKATVAGTPPMVTFTDSTTRPLPLVFASPNQVNAIVPYDLPVNALHQLVVRRGSALSVPEPVNVLSTQSGVFTKDLTGAGEGIAVVAYGDGTQSLAGKDNPVKAGDVLVLYCTGLGDVEPRAIAGSPTPATPLSRGRPAQRGSKPTATEAAARRRFRWSRRGAARRSTQDCRAPRTPPTGNWPRSARLRRQPPVVDSRIVQASRAPRRHPATHRCGRGWSRSLARYRRRGTATCRTIAHRGSESPL